jgi:hypothetical protein
MLHLQEDYQSAPQRRSLRRSDFRMCCHSVGHIERMNPIGNAIDDVKFHSRSDDAVIRVYDAGGQRD